MEVIKLLRIIVDCVEGAEGGTRHTLFAGVRPCPFRAGNMHVLFVAYYCFSLMFVGVAVRVVVQLCLRNEGK
jgi:hypothetical protein